MKKEVIILFFILVYIMQKGTNTMTIKKEHTSNLKLISS